MCEYVCVCGGGGGGNVSFRICLDTSVQSIGQPKESFRRRNRSEDNDMKY